MRWFLQLSLLCMISAHAFAFQKTMTTSKLYEQLVNTSSEELIIKNRNLIDDITPLMDTGLSFYEALQQQVKRPLPYDSMGLITSVKILHLERINGTSLQLQNLNIDSISLRKVELNDIILSEIYAQDLFVDSSKVVNTFRLQDAKIGTFQMQLNAMADLEMADNEFRQHVYTSQNKISGNFWITDCMFKEGAYLSADVEGSFIDFALERCVFEPIDSELAIKMDSLSDKGIIMKSQLRINLFGDVDQAYFVDNIFEEDPTDQYFYLEGDYDYMVISGNEFGSILYPAATVIKQFIMDDNIFKSNIILSEFIIQGDNNILRWEEMEGFKLATAITEASQMSDTPEDYGYTLDDANQIFYQTGDLIHVAYRATSDEELEDEETFQRLISSYYRLYKTFKDNGQIATSNQVYIEMKDVQSRELAFLYHTYGGVERWIEWRLNTILRLYTDYGTSPSKAIKISVWIISVFSIFYFFFPSEWDTKSKSQLISDYKVFIEKNEKGYFKPFLNLSFGFFRSLMNAFTLSLNSFVTLGFGTIPTSGLARYVCILQGFLGWFLLSIFTASLINQVMF